MQPITSRSPLFLALTLCLFWGNVVLAQETVRPTWADPTYIPSDAATMYYSIQFGILSRDTKSTLYNAAVAAIANQVETYVESVVLSKQFESGTAANTVLKESYENLVKATTSVQVYGEDLFKEEFYDPESNMYWIFLHIDKSAYAKRLQERIQASKNKALASYKSALGAESNGNYMLAIENYLDALDAIKEYSATDSLTVELDGHRFLIDIETTNRLRQVLGAIHIAPLQPAFTYRVSDPKKAAFRVWFQDGKKETPVSALPVKFTVHRGEGEIDEVGITDLQGIAECGVHKAQWSVAGLRIRAAPVWQRRLDKRLSQAFKISDDTTRYALVDVFLASPLVYSVVEFKSGSGSLQNEMMAAKQILMGTIIEHLTTSVNARVTESVEEADMQINLEVGATAFVNPARKGWRSSEVTCSLKLIDPLTQRIVYSPQTITTRGAGLTDRQALINALGNAKRYLHRDVITEVERAMVR